MTCPDPDRSCRLLDSRRTKATLQRRRCGFNWGARHVEGSSCRRSDPARLGDWHRRLHAAGAGCTGGTRRRGRGGPARGRSGREPWRHPVAVEGPRRRDRAELRGRSGLAEAACEQLANWPNRRHRRRLARQHLGLSPAADLGRELGRRDAQSGDECAGRADQRARASTAVRGPEHGLLHPGAVGAEIRSGRDLARRMGRTVGSGLPREELSRAGRLLLAGARARNFRRPKRLRVPLGEWPRRRSSSAAGHRHVSVGTVVRRRFARSEIHGGRKVRLPDRHGRHDGTEQREGRRRARTARRSRIWRRT